MSRRVLSPGVRKVPVRTGLVHGPQLPWTIFDAFGADLVSSRWLHETGMIKVPMDMLWEDVENPRPMAFPRLAWDPVINAWVQVWSMKAIAAWITP
jgi:hypothetical protein